MLNTLDLGGSWRATFTDHQRFGKTSHAEQDEVDESRYIDAQVPGEIHLDLMRAGLIADVYQGLGNLSARWVEECEWSFRRVLDVPAAATTGRAWLRFDGLDYTARIVLNGQEVGRHANSFLPCRVEVTGKLKPGRNVLTVHLESGLYAVADKQGAGYHNGLDSNLHKRHWLRKPQSHFGWDWSPRLLNVGIFAPCALEWTADAVRVDRLVPLATVNDDFAAGTVRARVFIEGLGAGPTAAKVRVEIPAAKATAEAEVAVKPGLHPYELTLTVAKPELWWPVGHGAQPLYDIHATVSVGGAPVARREARIGFRTVRVDQSPHPQGGRYFALEINGRKIFCKGGNFVPADLITAAIDAQRYRKLVDLALEANFNLLRVWGGGLYESDEFYRLCDEQGILVWQEFIFACSKYPGHDEAFRDTVKAEAIHHIRRLAEHPSLFAWCGNNELEVGYWDWGYDKGVVLPCHQLFHFLFPRLLNDEDPTRYYQPSSPFSPDHGHPWRDDVGDQHPWQLGFGDTDFRKYRQMTCRFPNEGGFLGPTSLPTMRAAMPTQSQQKPGSWEYHAHDNSIATWWSPSPTDGMSQQHLGKDFRAMALDEAVYWSGLVQGEALKEYCDNFRRRMFDSAAAVFWMYNDTWPAARSWTIVDHGLRRTPAFHPVRRALAPVNVVVVAEGDEVRVYGVNDTREAVRGDLRYGVFAIAGGWPIDRTAKVELKPNASTLLAKFPRGEWKDDKSSLAAAVLTRDGEVIARNRLVLPLFKELAWSPAKPEVTVKDGIATFTSQTYAWGVCLDLDGADGGPADNFFDLFPGVPHRIPWTAKEKPRILRVGNLAELKQAKA